MSKLFRSKKPYRAITNYRINVYELCLNILEVTIHIISLETREKQISYTCNGSEYPKFSHNFHYHQRSDEILGFEEGFLARV